MVNLSNGKKTSGMKDLVITCENFCCDRQDLKTKLERIIVEEASFSANVSNLRTSFQLVCKHIARKQSYMITYCHKYLICRKKDDSHDDDSDLCKGENDVGTYQVNRFW